MTKPVVLFPDAVLLAITYLRSVMPPDTVIVSRVPDPKPPAFVRVERLGGLRSTLVTDRPRIEFECWADTEERAESLMALTRAYVHAMSGARDPATVYRVKDVGGPQWVPDSRTGMPRYLFAIECSIRGTELD